MMEISLVKERKLSLRETRNGDKRRDEIQKSSNKGREVCTLEREHED
jgi:hypothetical protein